ncbi:hypothetical protein RhiirA4_484886 [Rhizophagus irregularis]|uniref:Uncharacterized protein n=1 Tax=Rhizophagus irregularis TaxID=588596 RepID=A0A2I1HPI5_9GLOM|nr:hypothetical protein RhiirA4_484886 [Rhizophagus irregularis]
MEDDGEIKRYYRIEQAKIPLTMSNNIIIVDKDVFHLVFVILTINIVVKLIRKMRVIQRNKHYNAFHTGFSPPPQNTSTPLLGACQKDGVSDFEIKENLFEFKNWCPLIACNLKI